MSLGLLVVTAVRIEGRTKAEVARDYGVSRRWVHELVGRFDTEGEAGLEPRSRRPRTIPGRTPEALEDEIVELRKELDDQGLDAGAHTIAVHLSRRHGEAPVLLVANALDGATCAELIDVWETRGNVETGVEQSTAGGREDTLQAQFKRRRDHTITDPDLTQRIAVALGRRIMPEIQKAFSFRATLSWRVTTSGCLKAACSPRT